MPDDIEVEDEQESSEGNLDRGNETEPEDVLEEQVAKLWKEYIQAYGDPFEIPDPAVSEDTMDVDVKEFAGPLTVPQPTFSQVEFEPSRRAGSVITPSQELVEEWHQRYKINDSWGPFSSETDWRMADWIIRDSASNSAADCLLKIPRVSFLMLIYTALILYRL